MVALDKELLKNVKYFNDLQDSELEAILQAPENEVVEYSLKDTIFKEGDVGEHMYIMLEGLAEVFVRSESSYRDISIASIKPGDIFGDGAATSEKKAQRSGTIRLALDSKVFRISKKYVLNAINGSDIAESLPADEVSDLLLTIPIFKGLTGSEIRDVKDWATTVKYKKDDFIHEPLMTADKLFIVIEGDVQIYVLHKNGTKHINSVIRAGQYFSEIELLPGGNGKHYQFAVALRDSRIIHVCSEIFDTMMERNKSLPGYLKQMSQLKRINVDHSIKT